ncbi:MAG TPA: hypothetical protein VFG04_12985 [Planctomycetaceae bacterium]|jgi:hypothetical protein|nr:hypothetical protein [Planctomycetaceae bacterium]
MHKKLVASLLIVGFGAAYIDQAKTKAASEDRITLMGSLAEWMYPKADFGGAQMSDGGNRTVQSVKCKAVLTTGDSFEQVTNYYEHKFVSEPENVGGPVKGGHAQAVSIQDDSSNRPVQVRVIVVNRANTSTTLVISRAKDETKTHIAWSHFARL